MTNTEEITALKATVADLVRRVTALESAAPKTRSPAPRPAPIAEEAVRICYSQESPNAGFVMPTDEELRTMFELSLARFPMFRGPRRDDEAFKEFAFAFQRLSELKRTAELVSDRGALYWAENTEGKWARERGLSGTVTVYAIVLAAIAHGDVQIRTVDGQPDLALFNLHPHSGSPAREGWKRALRGEFSPVIMAK